MFDIGFWELIVISVMGLVILGPERLPKAIRSVMSIIRSVKKTASQVGTELQQELRLQELHDDLKKSEAMQDVSGMSESLKNSVDELKARAESVTRPYDIAGEQGDKPVKPASPKPTETNDGN
ncbi:Sec-independent protein translocase subunit TatB [Alginatibacterium sediminis]|uniref:Sec-independent protein translocase protein TatB n=1 Tax=Alginatibacterium sediminis TaxID=2164068 RepID=A0A420E680_9ALTE|nr:Sec-independent protein translocase protein TatB [Alginatibacterium sediminis]RKF13303.1 Sec-independent protein translocase subunit TatB [Alginatibacterium sediminis]